MLRSKLNAFYLPATLLLWGSMSSNADVPAPPPPPQVPAGYCTTIYNELQGYLDSFNQTLGNPAPYPTLQIAQLQMADSNAGPAISGASYLSNVMLQVQELKAMGFQGVKVQIAFPVLYEPFYSDHATYVGYLNFYQGLAQNLKNMSMKLLVENNVTLSTGDEAGWPTVGPFYNTLNWDQFVAARATMAATIAQFVQPDFLMLSQEPDTEALNAGQPNLNTPSYAAAMISAEVAQVRAVSINIMLGAGFGTWMGPYSPSGLNDYLNAYVALPIDYLDMHIYPINTEYNGLSNLLQNTLIIANGAAAASKPIAISESWLWKMEDHEFNVQTPDAFRARNPFSFWAPIDIYFIQTMQKLANYTQMLYLTTQGNVYFQASQTYGGTTANGGAATCSCTTASCSNGDITATENNLADNAGYVANFTPTGVFYNSILVNPQDTIAPSDPSGLAGNPSYNLATLTWTGSASDNIGIAGYNILRCTPQPGQTCKGDWVGNSAGTTYMDLGLDDNTDYQYTVQAFDFANNHSNESNQILVHTYLNTPPGEPSGLTASPASPTQINLKWTPPQNVTGLNQYLIYMGTSQSSLSQLGSTYGTATSYTVRNLIPMTNYCFGVMAVEQNLPSPLSNIACATTLPLPNSPSSVVATPASSTRITLTWKEIPQPNGLAIANYQVFQGTTAGVMTKIATTTATTYNNQSLLPGTKYYYEVVAVDKSYDASAPSDPVSATTFPLPSAPSNLQASFPAATKMKLTWQWTAAPGGLPVARFSVYCGTSPTGQPKVATTTAYSYTYTGLSPVTQYFCYVVATDTGNTNSLPSSNLAAVTPPMPNAPANVAATANTSTKVTVTWSETIPAGGLPISNYKIYRSTTLPVTTANFVATRTTASYIDTTVSSSKTYYYAIAATDTGQDVSPLSASPAQVTTPTH